MCVHKNKCVRRFHFLLPHIKKPHGMTLCSAVGFPLYKAEVVCYDFFEHSAGPLLLIVFMLFCTPSVMVEKVLS